MAQVHLKEMTSLNGDDDDDNNNNISAAGDDNAVGNGGGRLSLAGNCQLTATRPISGSAGGSVRTDDGGLAHHDATEDHDVAVKPHRPSTSTGTLHVISLASIPTTSELTKPRRGPRMRKLRKVGVERNAGRDSLASAAGVQKARQLSNAPPRRAKTRPVAPEDEVSVRGFNGRKHQFHQLGGGIETAITTSAAASTAASVFSPPSVLRNIAKGEALRRRGCDQGDAGGDWGGVTLNPKP